MPATQNATSAKRIAIKRGLDLPILGAPAQRIEIGAAVQSVGLLGDDYVGMKPTMLVAEGDRVALGQPLFEDKKNPGVIFTSPGAGTVAEIIRGAKRKFEAVTVTLDGNDEITFDDASGKDPLALGGPGVTKQLIASGFWTSLRTRPYGKVPSIDSRPHSIFVTAMDTNPLAADPAVVVGDRKDQFILGLQALTQLTDGPTYVCKASGSQIPGSGVLGAEMVDFSGPHPAGLPGTHIHFLDPVGPTKTVWYIGYQDVIAIGSLFQSGKLDVRRIIALAGPKVKQPRLIETRLGARIDELIAGEVDAESTLRPISGSVLAGHKAVAPHNYLGRYHQQISVIQEGDHREFLGWQKPGFDKYSVTKIFASAARPSTKFAFTSSTGGSERAMVPMGTYEKVMPLDILATQLLRSLIVRDTDSAQQLGVLEVEEEDLALCTFVCPGKYEYGSLVRESLATIEREG